MSKNEPKERIKTKRHYMQVRQRSTKKEKKGTIMGKRKPKKRALAVVPLLVFLLQLTLCFGTSETRRVWGFDWEGMDVDIHAPYQAYPGDNITIRVRVEAKESLKDATVFVRLYSCKSEGYGEWNASFYALDDVDLSSGVVQDQDFDVWIPSDVSPGLVYSHTSCIWRVWRYPTWKDRSYYGVFNMTYLKNKPYEDLQEDYNDLLNEYNNLLADYDSLNDAYTSLLSDHNNLLAAYNPLQSEYDLLNASYNALQSNYNSLNVSYNQLQSDYNALQSDYTSLQNDYNNLNSTNEIATTVILTAVYIFIATTVILIATTIYFTKRKPKRRQKTKTKTKPKS